MTTATEILQATPPGSVTTVAGRPGSGVSSTLASVANDAVNAGATTILASWERPPSAWAGIVNERVVLPYVLGWSIDDLACCDEAASADAGSVVGVDYLQLIEGDDPAADLGALAMSRGWRVVLGVMISRVPSNTVGIGSFTFRLPRE